MTINNKPTLKYGGGSIRLYRYSLSTEPRLIENWMDGVKYRGILQENLLHLESLGETFHVSAGQWSLTQGQRHRSG